MRAPSAALMPLAEALAWLRNRAAPVTPRTVPLTEACGRIAAAAVTAPRPVPPDLTALHDGFAVSAADVGGASPYAPILLLHPPVRVEAGNPMPAGTDAVLPAEGLEGRNAVAEIGAGEGTRAAGEDLAEGDVLLAAGERIAPHHLLALAAAGFREVAIRAVRIRLVATGMSDPEVLSPMLAALITRLGGTAETVTVPDDPVAIARALTDEGDDRAAATFILGGSGFGPNDRSAEGLAEAGRLLAHGLALRPGETAAIGEAGGRPVLLLPGRPDAALAAFLALGRPLIAAFAGTAEPAPRTGALRRKITSTVGLAEIVFVRCHGSEIEPLGGAELPLRRLIEAEGAVLVPPEREGYPAGSEVEVVPL
ncbi:molybdopterin binding domain [Methylorubrum populi]|uniref:Molybdopterin molybdenumtransferase n=1 Tax=Methylorubrum populi TaxID=223967 RepID=A0A169R649_9HYPH|nr:molybdopterin-binding protein [Methylorubrum populi]BAU91742.1 molybdopterin binding domain [Methylorubrum populi]